jgi:predicted transcriptional regulator with HTH domain
MEAKKTDWTPLRDPVTKRVLASVNKRTKTLVLLARGGPKVYELAEIFAAVESQPGSCQPQENMVN